MKNYGKILKEHRLSAGKSLLDVEKDTGISNSNLSRWEQGKVLPNIDFCVQLADYYGISIDYLIGRADDFENIIISKTPNEDFSPEEIALLHAYRKLNFKNKLHVDAYISVRLEEQENSNNVKFKA